MTVSSWPIACIALLDYIRLLHEYISFQPDEP